MDGHYRAEAMLMVELQRYDGQGISVWLGDSPRTLPEVMRVGEDISYMDCAERSENSERA